MNIVFMGTPDFAETSLKKLYREKEKLGIDIVGVVTNPDMPSGRGKKLTPPPVKKFAESKEIPVYQPYGLRKNELMYNEIKRLRPDLIVVVAYGKILPDEYLKLPKFGCINVHGSLLPKYRGAAPIQWAILNGDKETGVTTMYMDKGMDTGDILLTKKLKIKDDETTGELWDRMKKAGAELLIETIQGIQDMSIVRVKQDDKEATIAPMLDKEMAKINWKQKTANQIKNLVRGLNPIMGAYSFVNGKKIKFWKVQSYTIQEFFEKIPNMKVMESMIYDMEPGSIVVADGKKGLYIRALKGVIEVIDIQGEGAKQMDAKDYLRGKGKELVIGSVFE